jgi:hypothetical protein
MSNSAPAPRDDEAPHPAVLRAGSRLRDLEDLRGIGMKLARGLESRAAADPNDTGPAEAFGPLSRAIRLTVALETRTDQELCDLEAGIVREREEERVRAVERRRVAAETEDRSRRQEVSRLVREAAEAEVADVEAFEDLNEAFQERLQHDAAYAELAGRPLRAIVERLCKDLCLDPDWSLWDGEGWTKDAPSRRPLFSRFNTPSARPLLNGHGAPVEKPAQRAHHELE